MSLSSVSTWTESKCSGYIDQVIEYPGGIIGPRDLKTGTKKPDWHLQLGVYKLGIEQEFGVTVDWGDWYMAKNNAPDPPASLTRFTKQYVTDLFHQLDFGIRSETFLPNPGDACRTCGVLQWCTAVGTQTFTKEGQ